MIKKFFKTLFILILVLGLGALALIYTPYGNQALTSLLSVDEIPPTAFKTLTLASSPNHYLVCPKGYCSSPINKEAPKFAIPVTELISRWGQMVTAQPRISHIKFSNNGRQVDLVQRTDLVRYPDIITARFIPIDDATSSIAIYSRSIYGKSDFGTNKSRIEAWITILTSPTQ